MHQIPSPNMESSVYSPMGPSHNEPSFIAQHARSNQHFPSTPISELPSLDATSAHIDPSMLLQAQDLQQSDENFGSFGRCKLLGTICLRQHDANRTSSNAQYVL